MYKSYIIDSKVSVQPKYKIYFKSKLKKLMNSMTYKIQL